MISHSKKLSNAVAQYWHTRSIQEKKQYTSGQKDQGSRSAVTGGAQMDGFITVISEIIQEAGIDNEYIFCKKSLELPGFFRPTKEWDILVVKNDQLLITIEVKSHTGPSFGNNFNNRTEEAMGSALDLWTGFREGILNKTIRPWLGYLLLLEDCEKSRNPVKVREPHFEVFPEFKNASYSKRYEIFCRKLIRERHYDSTCFIMSEKDSGLKGTFSEPAEDLNFEMFINSLVAQISTYVRK